MEVVISSPSTSCLSGIVTPRTHVDELLLFVLLTIVVVTAKGLGYMDYLRHD